MSAANPFLHMSKASRGDLDSLRALGDAAIERAASCNDFVAAIEALVFARLAAARGDKEDDERLLVMMGVVYDVATAVIGEPSCYTDAMYAEGLARVSIMADQGVEGCDEILPLMVSEGSPNIAAMAKQLRAAMLAVPSTENG